MFDKSFDALCADGRMLRCIAAVSYIERLLGLMSADLKGSAATCLAIKRCASIHTFGMHTALDVAFVNRSGLVVSALSNVGPNRVVRAPTGAVVAALERCASEQRWLSMGERISWGVEGVGLLWR